MHTWEHGQTVFTGNSDLSGDVIVTDKRTGAQMEVPGADIMSFAAMFVANRRISAIEQMQPHEVLGIPEGEWPR